MGTRVSKQSSRLGAATARLALMAVFGLALTLAATPSYAKKSALTPAKVRQAKKERKSYENCRKDALGELKKGALSKAQFEATLSTCKENFPGASLYVACKKSAVRTAKSKAISEEDAANQCKRYLTATTFDPKEDQPNFVESGQLFFAGIGLNRSQPTTSLAPPNFDCDRVKTAVADPNKAQYLLFGNHPRAFAGLSEVKGKALLELLKIKKPRKEGVDVSGFGRVFGDPKTNAGVAYFPAAPCDFEAESGDIYSGLSAYYLLDQASSSVTPYFGIAYYKDEQTAVTTPKLVQALIRALGSNYKAITKNRQVTFIAEASVAETDDEQDPKNLCRQPRPHRFIGVVQGQKNAPGRPEYVIVANVKNLCDFGDRMGKRVVE